MSAEYQALVAKVGQFVDATSERRRDDMQCRKGCHACCHAWLTVGAVEAEAIRAGLALLSGEQRGRARARGVEELGRERIGEAEPRCAMLEADGSCAIYAHRPLVCRTQGHALRYPPGFIPEQSLRTRSAGGDVSWCPLNYTARGPAAEDVLDAERVDQILALVTLRHVDGDREKAQLREAVSALAASKQ